ncbi:hypothetical protein [Anaeromyxobacter oryzae]|uniref:TonB C-terminal domain-containing protein n=1 Tax=Anaeromyxobacter oryzae TaxID=2918170 RepID=A0ABM7WNK8_9BACT|nr:hypothetical protein [Anaeromyxobacter oryzae]BDG01051.1 hypothetical protein AMOR_00470 [Anaeromyxobacter oryzae]
MGPITAVLPLVLTAVFPVRGAPLGPPDGPRWSTATLHLRSVRPDPMRTLGLDATVRDPGSVPGTPACLAEVCPAPSFAVPGGAAPGERIRRGEVLLGLLARSRFGPLATIASRVAESNVRLDYAPARAGGEPRGWGQVVVSLRWRLDANGPAASVAREGP